MNCMCNMKVVVSKIVIDNVLKSYMKWMKSQSRYSMAFRARAVARSGTKHAIRHKLKVKYI
jgi:hypothetical protein